MPVDLCHGLKVMSLKPSSPRLCEPWLTFPFPVASHQWHPEQCREKTLELPLILSVATGNQPGNLSRDLARKENAFQKKYEFITLTCYWLWRLCYSVNIDISHNPFGGSPWGCLIWVIWDFFLRYRLFFIIFNHVQCVCLRMGMC